MSRNPKHISATMSRARSVLDKMAASAPDRPVDDSVIKEKEQKLNTVLTGKYKAEIEALNGMEMEAWERFPIAKKNRVLTIRSKIDVNRFFSKSSPKIDMLFLVMLANNYSIDKIRERLNEAYQWLMANPDRLKKNYRRFILNFMKDKPYVSK